MIVPTDRLLFWAAVVGLPGAAAAALNPAASAPVLALFAGFALAAAADALFSLKGRSEVSFEFPPLVRMSRNRTAEVEFFAKNEGGRELHLRMALDFPGSIVPETDLLGFSVPGGGGRFRYVWPCRPTRRGSYVFRGCFFELRSRLGFWDIRAKTDAAFEVRVYPDLHPERRNLAALFLRRGAFGLHAQRQIGQGRDFEKLRDYVHGDSYENIHWKATARRGHPITKVYQIERTQEVYVIVDASRLSGRRVVTAHEAAEKKEETADTMLERQVTASLIMASAAERFGDQFGVLAFSDRVQTFLRARRGPAHYRGCRDALYGLQPRMVNPDFDELAAFIGTRIRRRALLVFLTSLDDPVLSESFMKSMELLSRRHLITVTMIRPEALLPLFSGPQPETTDDIYRRLAGHMMLHDILELEKKLQRRGIRLSLAASEALCTQLVSQYVSIKQRQLL
ncbi:MAG: DUF58 domain-containing protein [Thermodesulfovibrionales bacterium]